MNSQEKYYREKLYPIQDGVLNIVKKIGIPFYLTGGTALSRYYFNHRYSEDLDLFVNNDDRFSGYVDEFFKAIESSREKLKFAIDYSRVKKLEKYSQIFLVKKNAEKIELKIDLVNDIEAHFGDFIYSEELGKIDSWENILSNKISAVFRYEGKDFVDIVFLSRNKYFNWKKIIEQTQIKEAGTDPLAIYNILMSFPADVLDTIKWVHPIKKELFMKDIRCVAEDILEGRNNSLCR
ncbi:MAG: hypothetical protein DRP57_02500 [Spirochaetes bacterium]|nr:MAG: hypothetical protein DRP57_02500 [Spirochaetota bacterium]